MTHFWTTIIFTTNKSSKTSTMKTFCLLFALLVASSAAFAPKLFGVSTQISTQTSRYVIK
jgi:hypothetical protein